MYDFVYYFFYRMLRRSDDEAAFSAKLGVFIIIALHLGTVIKALDYFGVITFPRFSST